MTEKEYCIAKQFNIINNIKKLESELLRTPYVSKVEFDLNGFYDNMKEVIILVKYDIPVLDENYFLKRKEIIAKVIGASNENGLVRTGDRIEDYGEHFYFVFECSSDWV